MATGFRAIILAGLAIGGVGGFVVPDLKLDDAVAIQDRGEKAPGADDEPFGALHATAIAKRGPSDVDAGQTRPEGLGEAEEREATLADPVQMSASESPPVQLAALSPPDEVHYDAREESVVKKGKLRTIIQHIVKLVREDFTWKDPAAAEKAGMPQMDYVIGGMDRSFKLRLYHALRAMDEAGLAPGITSAFRDDYRQSLASGLKAATNRSYHGGSSHGGYGHGLAVDLASANGETDAERWDANEKLWNWIDAHGQDFGIGRPYLDKDPPHVAPIDGQEYAAHRHGGKQYADHRRARNTKQAVQ